MLTRFRSLASEVSYKGLVLEAGSDGWVSPPCDLPNYFLRWGDPEGTCNVSGEALPWWGRKWRLSEHMTDGEFVGTAFKALLTAIEHETRELFQFQGVAVYDSHVDIHKLVALRKEPGALAVREDKRVSPTIPRPFKGHLFEMVSGDVMNRCRYCGIDLPDSDGVSPCPKAP